MGPEKDEQMTRAIDESTAEALNRANSELMAAVLSSKADAPNELSADGVVLFRLDRRARTEEVTNALLQAPALARCRQAVEDAGCELQPAWANGAWLLVPMTQDLYREANICT